MKFEGNHGAYLELIEINEGNFKILNEVIPSELSLLWLEAEDNELIIDSANVNLNKNDIISLTEFHSVKVQKLKKAKLLRWNRAFYCIVDHDSEVSCKGILYYGAKSTPIIHPSDEELDVLQTVYKMLITEMKSHDNLQQEMLQMLLKKILIVCTRIYKAQNTNKQLPKKNLDIIREYNYLVEKHFKSKHTVVEYAQLLNKSPKTLSNLFKKNGTSTPLQFIQNRIVLEAKRQLLFPEKTISEIGYELGFSEVQQFSRFFKTKNGISPQKFRERELLTTS